jgi:uncharacterized protein
MSSDAYVEFVGASDARATVELASDSVSRARGLMFRPSLQADHGMLFVFPSETRQAFWGRDVLIPLSAGFIAADGTLLEIADINAGKDRPYQPSRAYQYVLEVSQGWFTERQVTAGQRMRFTSSGGPVRVS